jgi:RNA polymerase sigma-70 factor (ECF subfamily)
MHDHKQCRELFKRLSEYIDDELDRTHCEEIEKHLEQCPPCQACLATLKQTVALCREMKTHATPKELSDRLRLMIEKMMSI